jgi:hypothetical protein
LAIETCEILYNKGIPMSEEQRKKISETQLKHYKLRREILNGI